MIPVSAAFANAAFAGGAWFANATFAGHARFDNAVFSGDATFDNAALAGDATFDNAVFSGDARFNSATFGGNARFDSATFFGDPKFNNAAFLRYAGFQNAVFTGGALFGNAAFYEEARFDNAAFAGSAEFKSAVFVAKVLFKGQGALMAREKEAQTLRLTSARESEGIALTGTLETSAVILPITRRSFKEAHFDNAVFLGDADFSDRDTLGEASFRNVSFLGLAIFHQSNLHQSVSFHGAAFEAALQLGKAQKVPKQALENLWVGEVARREARGDWPEAAENDDKQTRKRVAAEQARLKTEWIPEQRKDLEAALKTRADEFRGRALSLKNQRYEQVENAFRTLKLIMEKNRNWLEEGRFFRLELLARRRRKRPWRWRRLLPWQKPSSADEAIDNEPPGWEWFFSGLYGLFSGFGGSVLTPILWVFGFAALFAGAYALMAALPVALPAPSDWWQAATWSDGRILPFGPWADEPAPSSQLGRLIAQGGGVEFGLRLLASVQSLLALVLVFLSGLALRRRFQIS